MIHWSPNQFRRRSSNSSNNRLPINYAKIGGSNGERYSSFGYGLPIKYDNPNFPRRLRYREFYRGSTDEAQWLKSFISGARACDFGNMKEARTIQFEQFCGQNRPI